MITLTLDSLITSIASNIVPVIVAIITAASSIIGIIFAQYLKVRQEIILRRDIELFDRKQKAYRDTLKIISKMKDHSYFLGAQVNWKILRYVYDEIMLIGSKEVVEKTNELLDDESSDSRGTDIKRKNLWNAIRKDLYGKKIPSKDMHMIRPSTETLAALSLYGEHSKELKSSGIDTLEKANNMDIDVVNKQTKIDKTNLNLIKDMAKKELEYEDELKRFLDDENVS